MNESPKNRYAAWVTPVLLILLAITAISSTVSQHELRQEKAQLLAQLQQCVTTAEAATKLAHDCLDVKSAPKPAP